MRKNYILLSCFLIFNITTLLSQNWVNNLGSNSVDQGRKIVKDAAGNSYVTGFFSGTMQLDASNVLSSAGQRDVFLAKYDPSGNLEWAKGIGGAEDDEGKDLAIDNLGNIYIADSNNNVIRRISKTRKVTTLAGSTIGFRDGIGEDAKFNSPAHLTIDSDYNIYVADSGNHRIRKITQE